MEQLKIQGIIPPILTPMDSDERVDAQALRAEVDRLIAAGVHGIFALGTNGEGYILDDGEKQLVLETVIEQVAGRVPVYAGTGCVGTAATVRMSRLAERLGADALSVITPSFAAASQAELTAHYRAVADAVNLPVVLYNIPARTGNALAPATVEELAAVPNIAGVKDSSGNFDNMLQYLERTGGTDFAVLSGNDGLILWNLLAGGAGGIAGCANVFPKNMVGIYEAFRVGDLDKARMYQDNIRPFRDCFQYGNPNTIVKTAAALLGRPVGQCRAPFQSLSGAGMAALRRTLADMGARGIA